MHYATLIHRLFSWVSLFPAASPEQKHNHRLQMFMWSRVPSVGETQNCCSLPTSPVVPPRGERCAYESESQLSFSVGEELYQPFFMGKGSTNWATNWTGGSKGNLHCRLLWLMTSLWRSLSSIVIRPGETDADALFVRRPEGSRPPVAWHCRLVCFWPSPRT